MGGVFAKSIPAADFEKALTVADLEKALAEAIAPINDSLLVIKDALLVDKGNARGAQTTVYLKPDLEGNAVIAGHGFLAKFNECWYFVTAAHVVAGDLMGGDGKTFSLFWGLNDNVIAAGVTFDTFYITADYIKSGSKDIGAVRLGGNLPNVNTMDITTGLPEIGKTVIGHGRIFLKGTVTHKSAEGRFMINASSLPGCSGCPVYDNTPSLVGIVHGDDKHRGDRLVMWEVPNEGNNHAMLQWAEMLPLEVLQKPGDSGAYTDYMKERGLAPDWLLSPQFTDGLGKPTLNTVMAKMHDCIWGNAQAPELCTDHLMTVAFFKSAEQEPVD